MSLTNSTTRLSSVCIVNLHLPSLIALLRRVRKLDDRKLLLIPNILFDSSTGSRRCIGDSDDLDEAISQVGKSVDEIHSSDGAKVSGMPTFICQLIREEGDLDQIVTGKRDCNETEYRVDVNRYSER